MHDTARPIQHSVHLSDDEAQLLAHLGEELAMTAEQVLREGLLEVAVRVERQRDRMHAVADPAPDQTVDALPG